MVQLLLVQMLLQIGVRDSERDAASLYALGLLSGQLVESSARRRRLCRLEICGELDIWFLDICWSAAAAIPRRLPPIHPKYTFQDAKYESSGVKVSVQTPNSMSSDTQRTLRSDGMFRIDCLRTSMANSS